MNDLQVRDHRDTTPTQKLATLREVAPAAVRARTRKPALVRRPPMPTPPVGAMPTGLPERITLGYLDDVVLTRDVLMHRIDIARATGGDARLDGDADRRVIADVVAEWGARHGQPFTLQLSGPAGGHYHHGTDGPQLALDAGEFCWLVSGRGPGQGLLATPVMFCASAGQRLGLARGVSPRAPDGGPPAGRRGPRARPRRGSRPR